MIRFALRRLLAAVPTLFAVLTLVFVIVRVIPGDPAYAILGDRATPEAVAALDARLGLDRPLVVQYVVFLRRVLSGDLGVSMATSEPVLHEIATAVPPTLELTAAAMLIGVLVGVPAGVYAALHRNRTIDILARLLSLIGLSFPVFVSGIFLLLAFAVEWHVFPVLGDLAPGDTLGNLRKLVLPAITLGLVMSAYVIRVTRSAMLQILGEDYMRTARAKGLPRRRVIWRHGLRNAALPVVTVVGLYVGILLGNSALTEIVFSRPGLGSVIVAALNARDYTMLQALLVVYCLLIVLVNLLTDIIYGIVDPRVQQG